MNGNMPLRDFRFDVVIFPPAKCWRASQLLDLSGVCTTGILSNFHSQRHRSQSTRPSQFYKRPQLRGLLHATGLTRILIFPSANAAAFRGAPDSILGSILSNLLLVLGTAFFAGGLFSGKKKQSFSSERWTKPEMYYSPRATICTMGRVCVLTNLMAQS